MPIAKYIVLLIFLANSSAVAADREVVYRGLQSYIWTEVDSMTDKRATVLEINKSYYVTVLVQGPNRVDINPGSADDVMFSPSVESQIRAGTHAPFTLVTSGKQNFLTTRTEEEAQAIIQALINGEKVLLRYFQWPSNEAKDIDLTNPQFNYLYNKASRVFGWPDLGSTESLPPAVVGKRVEGTGRVYVEGGDIYVDTSGANLCAAYANSMTFSGQSLMSFCVEKRKKPVRAYCSAVDPASRRKDTKLPLTVAVLDKDRNVVHEYDYSEGDSLKERNKTCLDLFEKAWEFAPYGTIRISNSRETYEGSLYGFPEIWHWAEENLAWPRRGEFKP